MNLQVVAKKAGVSVATVSRVVNNHPGVSDQKVKRIRAAIKELGFVPKTRVTRSIPSVAPKGMKYGNVAVLVLGKGHLTATDLFVRQLDPICHGLALHGISPILCMGATALNQMPPVLQKRMVDGILLFGDADTTSGFLDEIQRYFEGMPMFWMTSHHEDAGTHVLAGNREIGQMGASYCDQKECRRVLAVGSVMCSEVNTSRLNSFVEAASALSMEVDVLTGGKSDDVTSSINDAIITNDERMRRADAIFFPSDRLAASAYPSMRKTRAFDSEKLPIVISCGGAKSYLCGLDPRPVCIDMGADLIGQQAVEQVLWRIRNPGETRQFSVVIHPVLID